MLSPLQLSLPESARQAPSCGAGRVIIASILQVRTPSLGEVRSLTHGLPPTPRNGSVGAFTCSPDPPRRAAWRRCACPLQATRNREGAAKGGEGASLSQGLPTFLLQFLLSSSPSLAACISHSLGLAVSLVLSSVSPLGFCLSSLSLCMTPLPLSPRKGPSESCPDLAKARGPVLRLPGPPPWAGLEAQLLP